MLKLELINEMTSHGIPKDLQYIEGQLQFDSRHLLICPMSDTCYTCSAPRM
jgi:hypothetical protein